MKRFNLIYSSALSLTTSFMVLAGSQVAYAGGGMSMSSSSIQSSTAPISTVSAISGSSGSGSLLGSSSQSVSSAVQIQGTTNMQAALFNDQISAADHAAMRGRVNPGRNDRAPAAAASLFAPKTQGPSIFEASQNPNITDASGLNVQYQPSRVLPGVANQNALQNMATLGQ